MLLGLAGFKLLVFSYLICLFLICLDEKAPSKDAKLTESNQENIFFCIIDSDTKNKEV